MDKTEVQVIGCGYSGPVLSFNGTVLKNANTLEIEIQSSMRHNNIVRMDEDGTMERCEYTLMERIEETISESQLLFWIVELAGAVMHLHNHGILHRDIKPDNVYLLEGHVKLGDFGYACTVPDPKYICGTPNYMAPEIARAALDDAVEPIYSKESDCWALACCIHALYASPPFNGDTVNETLRNIIMYNEVYEPPHCPVQNILKKTILYRKTTAKEIWEECMTAYFQACRMEDVC